jgi:outer membrane protein TolC
VEEKVKKTNGMTLRESAGTKVLWRLLGGMALMAFLAAGCSMRPGPFTLQERQAQVARVQSEMTRGQEEITGPIDLYEAMARAVKYNLNYRMKLMEEAVSMGQAELAVFDLLPDVVASAGYTRRSNVHASSSESVRTGDVSLEASTSQDRTLKTADLTVSWNILDFGVSYFQAKQQADKHLIFVERRRKALHTLLSDVRYAFWRAAAVQQLESRVQKALVNAEAALEKSAKVEQEKLKPLMEVLRFQKVLLEVTKQLEMLQQELALAKVELAHLMNLPPGHTDFELTIPAMEEMRDLKDAYSLEAMETCALEKRPELVEIAYQKRISVNETRKTIAGLFPGISISLGSNYDSNTYLVNSEWSSVGTQLAWNLINLFSAPKKIRLTKAQQKIVDMQQMTLSMAVLSQVHIAYRQYRGFIKQFERNCRLESINGKIFEQTRKAFQTDTSSRVETIRADTDAIMSELQRYHSYAQLHNALGRLHASIGMDPLPADLKGDDIESLSEALKAHMEEWNQQFLMPSDSSASRHRTAPEFVVTGPADGSPAGASLERAPSPAGPFPVASAESEAVETADETSTPASPARWIMVEQNWSNIRERPAPHGRALSQALSGEFYRLAGEPRSGWYPILLDDAAEGWVSEKSARKVSLAPPARELAPGAKVTPVHARGAGMHTGAGRHYGQMQDAAYGTAYTVLTATPNWVEVRVQGDRTGWIARRTIQGVHEL